MALLCQAGTEEKRKTVVCCWVGIITEVVPGMLLNGKRRLVAGGADDEALVDLLAE